MKENKNIDRLFQEKFRDFEQAPLPHVWSNIEKSLSRKTKKRRPIWLWIGGVAAGLALLLTLNNLTPSSNNLPIQKTTDTKEVELKDFTSPATEVTKTNPQENQKANTLKPVVVTNTSLNKTVKLTPHNTFKETIITHKNTKTSPPSNTEIATVIDKKIKTPIKKKSDKIKKPVPQLASLEKKELNLGSKQKNIIAVKEKSLTPKEITAKKTTQEALADLTKITTNQSDTTQDNTDTQSEDKWSISTIASPVYMASFNEENSVIHESFNQNNKHGLFSKALGVQVAYQVSDRFSVQTGVHIIDYGYKTYNIYASPTGRVQGFNDDDNLIFISADPVLLSSDINQPRAVSEKGNLTQIFGYVEIPVEAKYTILKANFGIHAIAGFSTLMLNKNELYLETQEISTKIESATNLNPFNFTGNLGLAFDYKIRENIRVSLTPMVKIHANTFKENTQKFNPYALGLYSGLNFRF